MSTDSTAPTASAPESWPALTLNERRVLGVLVEKAKTTADAYPLSLNALTTGCNQKSNRDPILNLTDADVEDTLLELQKRGLVSKITGGRVPRWRHNLYENWHLDKVELAIIAELLLRGPQTEGELRGRADRMESIQDVEALRGLLRPLAERRLVVYLTPENRRGTVVTHGFHEAAELEGLRARASEASPAEAMSHRTVAAPAAVTALEARVGQLENEISGLRERLTRLEQQLGVQGG